MHITVPAIPEELHPANCWRKVLTSLDATQRGGGAAQGHWLAAGDTVDLPTGTIVITVDKATTGWTDSYQTGKRIPLHDSTVAAHLVTDAGLELLWGRRYQSSKSAFRAFTLKKLAALLAKHPAPGIEAVVVTEAQRPNSKPEKCRWCGGAVSAASGHLVRVGDTTLVEHWQQCPARYGHAGETCTQCWTTVAPGSAHLVMVREGEGRWEVRHLPELDCWENSQPSFEEQRRKQVAAEDERRARAAKQLAVEQARKAKAAERAAAKRAAADTAHDAEQARIAGLAVVSATATVLYDKRVGAGTRARLVQHDGILEDATTTTWWTVETYTGSDGWNGEDYDPDESTIERLTRLDRARGAYQDLKYAPDRQGARRAGGARCSNCERRGATHERVDSSGIAGTVCDACNRDPDYLLSFA